MAPVNKRLKHMTLDQAGPESTALIRRWGGLHAVRTGLGVAATLAFLWAVLAPHGDV